jgi:hypothetical protein
MKGEINPSIPYMVTADAIVNRCMDVNRHKALRNTATSPARHRAG